MTKDAFGLTDNLEAARNDPEDVELEVPEDGDRAGLGDVEMDEEDASEDEEPEELDCDSVDGEDNDWYDLEDENKDDDGDDGDLDDLVNGLGYDVL
jgi:hypothetical protein